MRYSTHSESWIFLESNIVPVSGENFLPQSLQIHILSPVADLKPFLTIIPLSRQGHDSVTSELDRIAELERDGVRAFYTNAYRSTDKAHCERNHEFFRYVVPKGHTLDGLAQI